MKLYYVPASCSLATHIVLRETGMEFDLERYDPAKGQTEKGITFSGVNAKARVPALEFDNGEILTEGAALVQYLVSQTPEHELALPIELVARARVQEGLSFVASDFHKSFSPFFSTDTDDAAKERAQALIIKHLEYLETVFGDGREYFVDNTLSVADIYLFVVLRWVEASGLELNTWKKVFAFRERMSIRPHVQSALEAEGLLEAA
ncbi:glutathione S-transferase family protein [Parvibaculaceae bacterium PLY_AMNH_Bact1]|nr:glutathione S-transferase family protein [Parvibaculaceae bacterium PLY_AMNH_Bact1]